jgi:hypothetical protein
VSAVATMLSVEIVAAVVPTMHEERFMVGPTKMGRMYGHSRRWARRQLLEWWEEQQVGGPVRVFRRPSGYLYTTLAVLDQIMPPRRRDAVLERWRASVDANLDETFRRLAELERAIGRRR